MLSNHSSIIEKFATMRDKFDTMYAKRGFIFWYVGEGMEEDEFTNARSHNMDLQINYDCY